MDQKDKELEDLFRPLGEKTKLPSTALTTEFKKKKRRAWTEDLPEMKFETKPPVKKKTPEEEALSKAYWEAMDLESERRKQEALERATGPNRKRTINTPLTYGRIGGASKTDPDYEEKRQKWTSGFAAGAGGR